MFKSTLTLCIKTIDLIFNGQYKKLVRFIFSGGTAAFTNIFVLFILVHFFHIYYLWASIISFGIATVVNFNLQKLFTFEDRTKDKIHSQFIAFTSINGINIIINTSLMYLFVTIFGIWYLISQFIASLIIAFISYFSYKTFVFSQQ